MLQHDAPRRGCHAETLFFDFFTLPDLPYLFHVLIVILLLCVLWGVDTRSVITVTRLSFRSRCRYAVLSTHGHFCLLALGEDVSIQLRSCMGGLQSEY